MVCTVTGAWRRIGFGTSLFRLQFFICSKGTAVGTRFEKKRTAQGSKPVIFC